MERTQVTLISALHTKYSNSSMQTTHCIIFVAPNAPGKTESGNLRVPENLALDAFNITSAGSPEEIYQLCSDVRELDLSQNNIRSWSEVFSILDCLPKLEFLNLTKNPLDQLDTVNGHSYCSLKKLAINFTNLTWNSVKNLLTIMPNLEEIYLSGNSYSEVSLEMPPYSTLRLLQLTSNSLSNWENITKIYQVFPNLTNLTLADNNIASCGDVAENSKIFKSLTMLNMNNTNISKWNDLDNLSCIASLQDVRLAAIPLLEGFDELKRRQLLSVYFPQVKRLNGSAFGEDERETAERVFLRHFMDQSNKPNRFALLEAKHGKLEPLVSVSLMPKETVALTVICGENEEVFDVPTKWTIGQLRRSLKSYSGASKFKLFHQANDGQGPSQIKQTNRYIWALNFRDGDKLFCDVDPSSPSEPDSPGSPPPSPIKEPPSKRR